MFVRRDRRPIAAQAAGGAGARQPFAKIKKHLYYLFSFCFVYISKGVLGVDERVRKGYCKNVTEQSKVVSILALAEKAGMSTGIVTTTRVSHATPAVAYASAADRNWEADSDIDAKDDGSKCKDIGNYTEVIYY